MILFAALVLPAEGRIGETSAECETRYGEGVGRVGRGVELSAGLLGERGPAWKAKEFSARGLAEFGSLPRELDSQNFPSLIGWDRKPCLANDLRLP